MNDDGSCRRVEDLLYGGLLIRSAQTVGRLHMSLTAEAKRKRQETRDKMKRMKRRKGQTRGRPNLPPLILHYVQSRREEEGR